MCKYDALTHPCDQPGSKTLSKPVLLKNKEVSTVWMYLDELGKGSVSKENVMLLQWKRSNFPLTKS